MIRRGMPIIVAIGEAYETQEYSFSESPIVIGRLARSHICVKNTQISRRHAQLDVTEESVVLTDLGSGNGTFVDGERLQAPRELKGGESVSFGERAFRIELVRAPRV